MNQQIRKALCLPRSTPISALVVEARIPPVKVIIQYLQRRNTQRMLHLPIHHIISQQRMENFSDGIIQRNLNSLFLAISPRTELEQIHIQYPEFYSLAIEEIATHSDREEEKSLYEIWQQIKEQDPQTTVIYTDGSQIIRSDMGQANKQAGVVYHKRKKIFQQYSNTSPTVEVLDSKVLAI